MPRTALFLILALAVASAAAEEKSAPAPVPPPSEEAAESGAPPVEGQEEVIEPQVTIIRREREVVEEYRIGGLLYMVKITPDKGYPYYLIDMDGDGSLETRRNELANPTIPQWILFRW